MVDPVTTAAVIGLISHLGGKVLDRVLASPKDGGVAVDRQGSVYALTAEPGRLVQPQLGRHLRTTTDFLVNFAPADDESAEYLLPDQPVVLLLEDEDGWSELGGLALLTTLDNPVEARLPPGNYSVAAIVFVDDDLDFVDGFGGGSFTVAPGQEEFVLTVPIVGDTDGTIDAAFQDVLAGAGDSDLQCRAITRRGERCRNPVGLEYETVCSSHGAAILEGSDFYDFETGEELDAI